VDEGDERDDDDDVDVVDDDTAAADEVDGKDEMDKEDVFVRGYDGSSAACIRASASGFVKGWVKGWVRVCELMIMESDTVRVDNKITYAIKSKTMNNCLEKREMLCLFNNCEHIDLSRCCLSRSSVFAKG
jgi:hypothetical protein